MWWWNARRNGWYGWYGWYGRNGNVIPFHTGTFEKQKLNRLQTLRKKFLGVFNLLNKNLITSLTNIKLIDLKSSLIKI
jgi:hypothetical protein